jgi:hypothetical protein
VLHNCRADNCFRNGLSVINGYNILIVGGSYDRSRGTPPQAGIDLEADPGGPVPSMKQVSLIGVQASGNAGAGFDLSAVGDPQNIEWANLNATAAGRTREEVGFRIQSPVRASRLRAMYYASGATVQGAEFIRSEER